MSVALIIDNDDANIEFLATCLDLFDIQSISAFTWQDGFEMARNHQPDAIITDLIMPDDTCDGYKTIAELKSHPDTQHIKTIAITAIGDLNHARELGCDDVLLKPFRLPELKKKLMQFLTTTM